MESYNRTHNPDQLFDFSSIPLKLNIEDVKSKFVTMYIYLDLTRANLTVQQRKYLPLMVDMWTTSPMIKNGTVTDLDGVIKRYNKVLLKYEMTQVYCRRRIEIFDLLNPLRTIPTSPLGPRLS